MQRTFRPHGSSMGFTGSTAATTSAREATRNGWWRAPMNGSSSWCSKTCRSPLFSPSWSRVSSRTGTAHIAGLDLPHDYDPPPPASCWSSATATAGSRCGWRLLPPRAGGRWRNADLRASPNNVFDHWLTREARKRRDEVFSTSRRCWPNSRRSSRRSAKRNRPMATASSNAAMTRWPCRR